MRGRRVLATLIDVACMLPWIGVVAAAGAVLFTSGITRSVDVVAGNIIGFVVLIAPITITAAAFEGSTRHATPGKRLMGFTLERAIGGGAGFVRALLRNGFKYAIPWELAHTAVFALVGSTTAPSPCVAVVLGLSYGIPIVSLVLLLVSGRALHDRVARTSVTSTG